MPEPAHNPTTASFTSRVVGISNKTKNVEPFLLPASAYSNQLAKPHSLLYYS